MIPLALAFLEIVSGPAPVAPRPCTPVRADRIVVRDFAGALPEMSAAPPDAVVAYAPLPGARRVFTVAEVLRIAARHGIVPAVPVEVCFEHPVAELRAEDVLAALRGSLGIPAASIEIAELSRIPVPVGELDFPRDGLSPPSGTSTLPALWRGSVRYAENRRFPVWARVRVRAPLRRIVAAAALPRGVAIAAGSVRVEEYEGFPAPRQPVQKLEDVLGRVPRRAISAGTPIWPESIETPPDVKRGEPVEIAVHSGAASLKLLATAETSGRVGETISVRNPESRRVFSARVTAKGKASVAAFNARQAGEDND